MESTGKIRMSQIEPRHEHRKKLMFSALVLLGLLLIWAAKVYGPRQDIQTACAMAEEGATTCSDLLRCKELSHVLTVSLIVPPAGAIKN